jgi:ribosome-binding protein aMBF1 (putative translation factor)
VQPFGDTNFGVSVIPIGYFMYQSWGYPAPMSMGQQPRRHSALNDALAEEIRAQRRAIEMSQAELGRRAGVSRGQVVRIESKERILDVTQVDAFARALGVSMVDLLVRAERRIAAQEDPDEELRATGG